MAGAGGSSQTHLLSTLPLVALGGVLAAAVLAPGLVLEKGVADFVIVTCFIGGWAAYMSGRAIAATWRPYWQVVAYMLAFALVVRWVHFALFHGKLLSLQFFLVDFVVVWAAATLGFRLVRAGQMVRQYGWLVSRAGPFGWTIGEGRG